MFLQPKKTKYKKIKKGNLNRIEYKSNKLKFGTIGLKAISSGTVSARNIEATRRAVVRKLQRKGKVWLKIFPDRQVTNKPSESRMGKGKGAISFWASKVARGQIILEIAGVPEKIAREALTAGGHKLSVRNIICK